MTPPPLPPDYIDPDHTGRDRGLLEVFYQAARVEGGTADECIPRGLKAVLAAHPTTPPAPELGEVVELVEFLGALAAAPILTAAYADQARRAATLLQQQATGLAALRKPPHPTFLDAIRPAQGCHDYSGGHSGQQGEAFQDGVGTVVAVLKRAAIKPWDFQTMAVFGVGSAPQAGEGEAS